MNVPDDATARTRDEGLNSSRDEPTALSSKAGRESATEVTDAPAGPLINQSADRSAGHPIRESLEETPGAPSVNPAATGPRILIVDDQRSNVRLLEHTLRRAGFAEVMSTVEPREVAGLHSEHHYDLILLDLQMPEMSGIEVLEQLQATRAAHRFSVLVLSADPSQQTAARDAGADDFLSKPFRLPDVVDRIRLMLEPAKPTD